MKREREGKGKMGKTFRGVKVFMNVNCGCGSGKYKGENSILFLLVRIDLWRGDEGKDKTSNLFEKRLRRKLKLKKEGLGH